MRRPTSLLSTLLAALAIVPIAVAFAAPDTAANEGVKVTVGRPEKGAEIFANGKGDAAPCQACHGEKALGNDAIGAPRLANVGQIYLFKQLNDFAADRRTPEGAGAVMNSFAKALSEQDRLDLAVYLNTLEYVVDSSDLETLAASGVKVGNPEIGKRIVSHGIPGKVPVCQNCHGFNGRDPRFPAINQQKYVYLVNQLQNWRSGARANDPEVEHMGIMRRIGKLLSDDDIVNIAAFLSTAPRVSPDEAP
jgi:cytochrome c553